MEAIDNQGRSLAVAVPMRSIDYFVPHLRDAVLSLPPTDFDPQVGLARLLASLDRNATIPTRFRRAILAAVHPLIFEPIFKRKPWGGRKLETVLDKALPPGESIGESWELADLEADQSVVAVGPLKGKTITLLVKDWAADLLGSASLVDGRFPLLIKFLDARETLSVQVHPDEAMARKMGGPVRVKHEAWYVIDAESESLIYRGLNPGVDATAFRTAIETGEVQHTLRQHAARRGHSYYLPSGTVHALGAGTLVAEVQTPSDITYRVFDWNRIDPATGQPRQLHIDEAMACIDFSSRPIKEEVRQHVASVWTAVTSLVLCDSFRIERVRMVEGVDQELPYEEFMIWIVLEGKGTIAYEGGKEPLPFHAGDTILIPAALKKGRVRTADNCMWLEVSVPVASTLADFDRPDRASLSQIGRADGGVVPLNVPRKPTK